jgi:hypothetical protein
VGFAEFRNKTLTLYQARIRSLQDQYDDNCIFNHPGFRVEGRWYGGCRDGLAYDHGYGVIRDSAGNSVEYLGTALDGKPSGSGGMITRYGNQAGAFYHEGGFSNGLPDGVLWVEEPGRKPRIREFRAGKDVGSGVEEDIRSLVF